MGTSSAMPNVALLGYWVLNVIVKKSISKGRWKWRIPPGRHGLYNDCITLIYVPDGFDEAGLVQLTEEGLEGSTTVLSEKRGTSRRVEMFTSAAMRSGFGSGGDLVVDFPHSWKAKKHFLVLYAGSNATVPQGLMGTADGKG
ncbi:hypothetical protein Pmar_PMAR002832 [Perkinsus marinus ATCC 50983]|uniref:Uncharacterized protein n=1 Tax=Perkinsus marinus (strain ATCC 50983 / TXsc) TaxID=423536 RepID=C5LQN2_PERM5|nr:hypothetical protein Pmar_PMAR002832 [Perkinsus marinus ATCC 50983]EER00767.1 hypothetical protein Pmar_PMAR002832 [Perkinsus marinus ATCC 50983]|eukprot:XP_002768049.1 hypothetical protein Pmar_PMAR002832 [Perkinsus marinus ATCC 50983]